MLPEVIIVNITGLGDSMICSYYSQLVNYCDNDSTDYYHDSSL